MINVVIRIVDMYILRLAKYQLLYTSYHYSLYFQVFVGGAADGVLYPGDKVASINHQDTSKMTHHDAQNLLRKAGTSAQLNIVRPGITDNQQGMKLNRSSSLGSSGSGKSITNLRFSLL